MDIYNDNSSSTITKISNKSSKKSNKKIKNLLKQLDNDSNEITKLMENCMKEREETNKRQRDALLNFQSELLEIGDINNSSWQYKPMDPLAPPSIDHNIMRSITTNSTRRSFNPLSRVTEIGYNEDYDNYYEVDNFDDNTYNSSNNISKSKSVNPKKNNIPSFDEKKEIRAKLFSFLDKAHEEEETLEKELEIAKQVNDIKVNELEECLYVLQMKNYKAFSSFIKEYQPNPYNKAWGNDPDYIAISKKLRDALLLDDTTNAAHYLASIRASSILNNDTSKKSK
mmetsp:Transcript_16396/g.14797  ORF Transcript_16396/g.14797 Transcript_16396/m.14797 type:complete len:283 (+) Transcript_16396:2-850(+)